MNMDARPGRSLASFNSCPQSSGNGMMPPPLRAISKPRSNVPMASWFCYPRRVLSRASQSSTDEQFEGVPAGDKYKMIADNTARLYKLPS